MPEPVTQDIEAYARAVAELRESEERLRLSNRAAEIGTWRHEIATDAMEADEVAQSICGLPGRFSIEALLAHAHPDDRAAVEKTIRRHLDPANEGLHEPAEFRYRHPDGSERWFAYAASVQFEGRGADRHPVRTFGVVRDVTRAKVTELGLLEANQRLRLANAAASIGTWWHDIPADVLHLDALATAHFGLRSRSSTSQLMSRIHPDDRARLVRSLAELFEPVNEGLHHAIEYRLLPHETGGERWVHVEARVVFEGDAGRRRAVRGCGVVLDVTERHRAEAALQQALADLRETDRQKDDFLATLAHELRNPMSAIRTAVAVLGMHRGRLDGVGRMVDILDRQSAVMHRLVDDLMDVNRAARGKIVLERSRVELGPLVRQAAETVRSGCAEGGIELTVRLPSEPVFVSGDAARIFQILANLLGNACKFTDRGGRVDLAVESAGREAVLSVRDDGIGIAPDHLSRIFDLYAQADTSVRRRGAGLGIGLALVRRLVDMHGGRIEARSEGLGHGSEFVVRLPLDRERRDGLSLEARQPT